MYLPWKARLCSISESLSGFFLLSCSFVAVYHKTGRWGTDPAPNPVRNWRKWHQPLPAVTCNLCSGLWHRAHIFLHLSLIGLKTRVSKCEDLGRQDRERREYPGWQSLALRRNLVPSCLLLSWDPGQTSLRKCGCSSVLAAYGRAWVVTGITKHTFECVILEMYSLLRSLSDRKGQWEATEGSDQGIKPSIAKYGLKKALLTSQCLLQQGTRWLENWPPTSFLFFSFWSNPATSLFRPPEIPWWM